MFEWIRRFTPVGVLAMLAVTALPLAAQTSTKISITTGGTGGVYYPLGGAMANILSKYVPGLQATAEVTGGSVDNLKLIGSGKINPVIIVGVYNTETRTAEFTPPLAGVAKKDAKGEQSAKMLRGKNMEEKRR